MDKLIESKTKESRKQKTEGYKNYILNHWKGIQNMKNSLCKSSLSIFQVNLHHHYLALPTLLLVYYH